MVNFISIKEPEVNGGAPDVPKVNGTKELRIDEIREGYTFGKTYSYERLIDTNLPDDVDPSRKEAYLTDPDFKKHLVMDRAAFEALPKWKQINLKKAARLF